MAPKILYYKKHLNIDLILQICGLSTGTMRQLLFVSLLFLAGENAYAATDVSKFDIFLFGDKIGYMNITRDINEGGVVTYILDSYSKAKVLWINKEVTSRTEVTYKDGKLIASVFKETENGKVTRWYNISNDGKVYTADGYKGKKTFTQVPTFSVVSIFYKDLKNVTQVFDEAEAEFDTLVHTDADTYEFKAGNGTRNVYHVVNGKVQTAEFHVTLATVKMVRVN